MHDNGRGVARVFDKLLVLSWVLLVGGVVWHVHQWDPTTPFIRDSPDQTNFPGYSSFWDTVKYNPAFQGHQMRPDSLKFPVFI